MKAISSAILATSLITTSLLAVEAQTFFITDEEGNRSEQIEFKNDAAIVVGGKKLWIEKKETESNQFIELLRSWTLPQLQFRKAPIADVISSFQRASVQLDSKVAGLEFIYLPGDPPIKIAPVTFSIQDASMEEALSRLCNIAGLKYLIRNGKVIIAPVGVRIDPLIERTPRIDLGQFDHMQLRDVLAMLGVEWPEGSSIKSIPVLGVAEVVNTAKNMRKIEKLINSDLFAMSHIEIEAHFVEYDLDDLADLAMDGIISAEALMKLRKKGKGTLIAAPRVVTKSGQQATVKGVSEIIYPTDFSLDYPYRTNSISITTNTPPMALSGFETREVGALLEVLPEMSMQGHLINLTLTPQIVHTPTWHKYEAHFVDDNGNKRTSTAEQPFFHVETVTTSVALDNGGTVLIGGGMPGKEPGKVVYCFISAQIVGTDGKPIKDPF